MLRLHHDGDAVVGGASHCEDDRGGVGVGRRLAAETDGRVDAAAAAVRRQHLDQQVVMAGDAVATPVTLVELGRGEGGGEGGDPGTDR